MDDGSHQFGGNQSRVSMAGKKCGVSACRSLNTLFPADSMQGYPPCRESAIGTPVNSNLYLINLNEEDGQSFATLLTVAMITTDVS